LGGGAEQARVIRGQEGEWNEGREEGINLNEVHATMAEPRVFSNVALKKN